MLLSLHLLQIKVNYSKAHFIRPRPLAWQCGKPQGILSCWFKSEMCTVQTAIPVCWVLLTFSLLYECRFHFIAVQQRCLSLLRISGTLPNGKNLGRSQREQKLNWEQRRDGNYCDTRSVPFVWCARSNYIGTNVSFWI